MTQQSFLRCVVQQGCDLAALVTATANLMASAAFDAAYTNLVTHEGGLQADRAPASIVCSSVSVPVAAGGFHNNAFVWIGIRSALWAFTSLWRGAQSLQLTVANSVNTTRQYAGIHGSCMCPLISISSKRAVVQLHWLLLLWVLS